MSEHAPQRTSIPAPGASMATPPTPPTPSAMPRAGVAPYPTAPTMGGVPTAAAPSNILNSQQIVEKSLAVVSYIAFQTSYFKKGVIKASEASQIYREFQKTQAQLPAGHKDKVDTKKVTLDNKGVPNKDGKTSDLTDNYSAARFRTFCTEEWKKMIAKQYCEIVMSESKAEFFVIKAFVPANATLDQRSVIVDKIKARCSAKVDSASLFVVRKSNMVGYMTSAGLKSLHIYNDEKDYLDNAHPDGYITIREKVSQKDGAETNYVLRFVKVDKAADEVMIVPTIKQIIPKYAVNRDMSRNHGKVCTNRELITNIEKFEKLFPEVADPCAIYGEQVNFTKNNPEFASTEALKAAKAETFLKFGEGKGQLFAEIGLTEDAVKAMRDSKSGKGGTTYSLTDILNESNRAAQNYLTNMANSNKNKRKTK